MFDWVQVLIDWLGSAIESLKIDLNPFTLINAIAEYVASLLPAPDPQLQVILDQAVTAVGLVSYFISLMDFVINLPVWLAVIGIILTIETALNVTRAWKFLRAFIT